MSGVPGNVVHGLDCVRRECAAVNGGCISCSMLHDSDFMMSAFMSFECTDAIKLSGRWSNVPLSLGTELRLSGSAPHQWENVV